MAVQQMIAIARAVDVDAKVLILDEPTSSLDEEETQRLFAVVRKLKARAWGSSLSPTSWIRSMSSATGSRCCATVSWWALCRGGAAPGGADLQDDRQGAGGYSEHGQKHRPVRGRGADRADGLSAFGRIQDFDLQIHRGEVVALPACWAQAARKRQSFWPAWPSPNRAHCG